MSALLKMCFARYNRANKACQQLTSSDRPKMALISRSNFLLPGVPGWTYTTDNTITSFLPLNTACHGCVRLE